MLSVVWLGADPLAHTNTPCCDILNNELVLASRLHTIGPDKSVAVYVAILFVSPSSTVLVTSPLITGEVPSNTLIVSDFVLVCSTPSDA